MSIRCEIEVIPGLEAAAVNELHGRFGRSVTFERQRREGLLPITLDDIAALLDLKTVLAVYGVRWFAIPRPKALLGNAEFGQLHGMIEAVRALHPPSAFHTFRLSAAGTDSPELVRLRERIALETGLEFVADEGDLLVRLRRPLDERDGWEASIRLTPRPLSARAWRVCNLPGALNASVAHAMVHLSRPHPDDVVLNLACGSGTLLIERRAWGAARLVLGCDTDAGALQCAHDNRAASGHDDVALENWDAGATPLPAHSVDSILVDLPFGQLVGSHTANQTLYPRILDEAARVATPGATFVAITQDIRLWENELLIHPAWRTESVWPISIPFSSGYLHPRIWVLSRR